jgi:ATP-binding cassette, subfamily B, bacterial
MYFDRRLFSFTSGVRGRIVLAAVVGLAAVPVAMLRLALTGQAMARVFTGEPFEALVGMLVLIAALVVVRSVLQLVRDEIANTTAALMKVRMRGLLYQHILVLGAGYFDQRRSGDAALALVDGVEQLDQFFGQYLPQLVVAALTPLIVFGFMAVLDLPTATIFLLFALLTLLTPAAFHRLNSISSMAFRRAQVALGADFLDSIQGLATLKAFGQSTSRGVELAHRARDLYKRTMWVLGVNIATGGITLFMISAAAAVALGWGAVRVEAGQLPLSTLLVVLLLGVEVFRPLRDLVQLFHGSMLAVAATRGMYQLFDAVPEVESPRRPVAESNLAPTVTFENVTFGYHGGRRPAVAECSFQLRAGETLGVVGPSGAGKSTLINLLLRLADPQSGQVLLGGHDVRQLSLDELRAQVAVVAQDTYLFYGTVADNLRVAKADVSEEELESACRIANAHEFIAALPAGYDTIVGERGVRLSGGQRQRLAIARALLKNAPILVLDEALSSVDADNEASIRQALQSLQQGRTTLVIAHRLSSISGVDRVIVMDRGRVVETGTPLDLLTHSNGVYARLMAAQHVPDDDVPVTDVSPELESSPTAAVPRALVAQPARMLPAGQVWVRLLGLVKPWAGEATLVLALGPLHAVSQVALGVVSAILVAQVFTRGDLTPWLIGLAILVPLTAVLRWLDSWISHDLAYRLLAELRIRLYQLLDPLAPAYLVRRRSGDLVSALLGDVELIELFYAHTISPLFVAILIPGGVLIALALRAPTLALVLLPFLVAVALTPLLAARQSARLGASLRDVTGEVSAHAVDSIQGLRTIAAFDYGERRGSEIAAQSQHLGDLKRDFLRWQAVQNAAIEALIGLGTVAVVAAGALLAAAGELPRTLLPLVTLLAVSSFQPVTTIVTVAKELAQTLGGARRYFAVEDEPVAVLDGPGAQIADTADVHFDNVTFAYGSDPPALREVTFAIPAGQTVALVGRSGAGKTTAAHLLLRFWDPQSGAIRIGDRVVRELRLDDLRGLIALVAQDTYLFNTSLIDNIRLAHPDATDEQVLQAARDANVDEFAELLPEGYATSVGERGLQLSGGQRQRVAIARALLKDAPILVLDEATSHLDAVSEAEVRRALERLRVGRTTLVIAHRLSTIRDADLIVVLEAGRVVEQGRHADLLALDGLYSHLIASQLRATAPSATRSLVG